MYQINKKTVIDMPRVVLMSAVATTRKCSMPNLPPAQGSRSTGNKSIKFIKNTSTKMVMANGAISRLLP